MKNNKKKSIKVPYNNAVEYMEKEDEIFSKIIKQHLNIDKPKKMKRKR